MTMYIILGIIVIMFLLDIFISLLNYRYRNKPIPENVADIYDEAQYKKWLNYSMDQTKFSFFSKTFNMILMVILLISGAFKWVFDLTSGINSEILQNLTFLLFYFVIVTFISIPFGYYQTFVIEEKYGFNKTTKKIFIKDQIKNFFLMALLFGGIVSSLNALYLSFRDRLWIFVGGAWLVLVLFITVLFVLNTKVFVKVFNKLSPLPDGELRTKIEEMAKSVGFEIKAISMMDASKRSTKLNAFFSGLGKTREVVLYDTLVEKLSTEEILSVLAHELGHAMHKDAPRMLFERSIVFGLYAILLGFVLTNTSLYTDFGISAGHLGFGFILFMILLEPIDFILEFPLNYLSRRAEYAADAYSANLIDKKYMISALRILVKENFSNLNPHPLFEKRHYSHPKISDRLKAIEQL